MSAYLGERNELEVYTADDGIDALLKVYSAAPQVIIWAMERPDYWGSECLLHMKQQQPALTVLVLEDAKVGKSALLGSMVDRFLPRATLNRATFARCVEELCHSYESRTDATEPSRL
jgi:CheY-like chemotaxis protein